MIVIRATIDLADHLQDLGHIGLRALLGDDREPGTDPLAEAVRAPHAARIRRNDYWIRQAFLANVIGQQRPGLQVIDRDIEKAFDRRRV